MATVARSGQHKARAGVAEVLDDAEQVVPAPGVQAGGVVAQFVEDLVHLERGRDGLDQHGGADGALRDAEVVLREDEDLVPEPRLEVALHLGQVVVRALAVVQQLPGGVEEVQAEVHQGAHGVLAADQQVALAHVPAARAGHDDGQRGIGPQRVFLALGEVYARVPAGGVAEVQDRVDHVGPGGRAGVLEVGEPHLGAGVQGVDGHLGRRGRAGHLHPAVLQGCRGGGNAPVALADVPGLRQEIQPAGPGHLLALDRAGLEQVAAGGGEALVQFLDEGQGLGGEDFLCTVNGALGLEW